MADEVKAGPTRDAAPDVPQANVATPDQGTAVIADPVRGQIDALAAEFGFSPTNFSSFKDVDSARGAIKLAVEMGANRNYGGGMEQPAAPVVNLPADRFSKPTEYKPIDYKSFGLEDDDAAAKALRVQEQHIKANDDRIRAMETRLEEQRVAQQQQAEQAVMQQADEIISSFASTRYGTSMHRTSVQGANMEHLIRMAGTIRRNSGGSLPLKACLNQARLLDEGATTAMSTILPQKKTEALSQGGAPALSEGLPKLKMTDQWSQDPAFREKYQLPPSTQFK